VHVELHPVIIYADPLITVNGIRQAFLLISNNEYIGLLLDGNNNNTDVWRSSY